MNALLFVYLSISLVAINTAAHKRHKRDQEKGLIKLELSGSPHKWQGNVLHPIDPKGKDKQYLYLCDQGWNLNTANVICKELGFPEGASFIYFGSKFPLNRKQVIGAGELIWRCKTGLENSTMQCGTNPASCTADEVAGVQCKHGKFSGEESRPPNCTFDKDTCRYKSSITDGDILWQQMTGKILDNWKYQGKYMYLMQEGSGLGTKGQLKSPPFTTGDCLKFLYFLSTNKGSLSVYLSTQNSHPELLWRIQGVDKSTNKWEHATIPLKQRDKKNLQPQLIFEGEVGISDENVIAVDNVTLATAKGCKLFPHNASPEKNKPQTSSCKQKTSRGKCCKFPFVFHGAMYNFCVQLKKGENAWCAIEENVLDVNEKKNESSTLWDECRSEEIRLAGDLTTNSRPVQVSYKGRWGYICGDASWDKKDADVVCRQLGFHGAKKNSTTDKTDDGPFWLQEVNCRGGEPSLSLCLHRGWGISNCPRNQLATVECDTLFSTPVIRIDCKENFDEKKVKTDLLKSSGKTLNEKQVTIIVSKKTVYVGVNGMKQKKLNELTAGVDKLGGCKVIKSPTPTPPQTTSKHTPTPSSPLSSSSSSTTSSSPRDWLRTLQYGGVLLLAVSAALLCYCVRRKKPCVEGEPTTYTKVPSFDDDSADRGNGQASDTEMGLIRKKEKKLNKLASKNC